MAAGSHRDVVGLAPFQNLPPFRTLTVRKQAKDAGRPFQTPDPKRFDPGDVLARIAVAERVEFIVNAEIDAMAIGEPLQHGHILENPGTIAPRAARVARLDPAERVDHPAFDADVAKEGQASPPADAAASGSEPTSP